MKGQFTSQDNIKSNHFWDGKLYTYILTIQFTYFTRICYVKINVFKNTIKIYTIVHDIRENIVINRVVYPKSGESRPGSHSRWYSTQNKWQGRQATASAYRSPRNCSKLQSSKDLIRIFTLLQFVTFIGSEFQTDTTRIKKSYFKTSVLNFGMKNADFIFIKIITICSKNIP